MIDILLTHGYFLSNDPIEQRVMKPYVPLGILSIAAYLDRCGFQTAVFDSTFASPVEFENAVARLHPLIVGISVNMMTKFAALRMIQIARRYGTFIAVGGPEPPHYAEEFLTYGADVVVIGEGEQTAADLVRMVKNGRADFAAIPGLAYRNEAGAVIRTTSRAFVSDLDSLPNPDRTKVDLEKYLAVWRERHGYTSLSMVTMRGCPYTCTWCSHAVYGESYRRRSPEAVVDELQRLIDSYSPDAFWFADDVFTINHEWLNGFARELRERRVHIRYECITRADRMNHEVVQQLRSSGCSRVWIGSESGSQRILDAMSRRVKAEQIRAVVKLSREAGIEVGMFIMLGYNGEQREDIEQTVHHVKAAHPDIVLTTVAYPIKGTTFYREVTDRLRLPSLPFDQWNDRMIDIAGRYSRRFYWFANRRIINEAAWSRMLHNTRRSWLRIATSFIKAKASQLGMSLTQ